jgi:HPt (histidine-containing phosphotransfer) domain-containing protein
MILLDNLTHINLDYLETMTGGDPEMMDTMLSMLLDEIPTELEKMHDALAIKDWEELFQLSHKFKTTLGFVGNEEMTNINKTLEHCSRNRIDLAEAPSLVNQLSALSKPVMAELRSLH